MNPDELPVWFAVPACIVLCVAWVRVEIKARQAQEGQEQ